MSCWSRAGCCCGWKSASKFQKELSTKLSVGISVNLGGEGAHLCLRTGGGDPRAPLLEPPSTHPISRKIWRSSERTLSSGCRCPQAGGSPSEEKL